MALQNITVAYLVNKYCRSQRQLSVLMLGVLLGLCLGCSLTLLFTLSWGRASYAWDPVTTSARQLQKFPVQPRLNQEQLREQIGHRFKRHFSATFQNNHVDNMANTTNSAKQRHTHKMQEGYAHELQDLYVFRKTLLVAVVGTFSVQPHREMVEAAYTSWGQDVSHIVLFVGEESIFDENETEGLEVARLPELSADDATSVQGIFAVLKYINEHFVHDYNWIIIIPVNTYVNGRHLQDTLAHMSPEEVVYLGRSATLSEENDYLQLQSNECYCLSETGVVFSWAALQKLIHHLGPCLDALKQHSEKESSHPLARADVQLGHCVFQSLGVQCANGSDTVTSQLFFWDLSHEYEEFDALAGDQFFRYLFTFHPVKSPEHMMLLHFFYKTVEYYQMDRKLWHLNDLNDLLCQVLDPKILEHPQVRAQCLWLNSLSMGEVKYENNLTILEPTLNKFQPTNHLEVQTWVSFDAAAMYEDESILPRRSLKTYKHHSQELQGALAEAVQVASSDYSTKLNFKKILHGWVKHDGIIGNEYIIDIRFLQPNNEHYFIDRRVHLIKPLASNFIVRPTKTDISETIHIVVPISNVIARFDEFMLMYEKLVPKENIHLLLVVYGEEEIEHVSWTVSVYLGKDAKVKMTVIPGVGSFSRAKALDLGMQHLQDDDLVFFCDVDMMILKEFLNKCRKNTLQGQRVYYPEVFKMYNKEYVYRNKQEPKRFELSRNTGHWGYYAYGMLCIYKSDYRAAGGLNTGIMGWGGEDVEFYERILRKKLEVFRAPDGGLIHQWHTKNCGTPHDDDSSYKYEKCMDSKAEILADRRALARYIFSIEQEMHGKEI